MNKCLMNTVPDSRGEIEVVYFDKKEGRMYRKILQEREYSKNELGQIKLPENHYSKRDIERGNEGVADDFPLYDAALAASASDRVAPEGDAAGDGERWNDRDRRNHPLAASHYLARKVVARNDGYFWGEVSVPFMCTTPKIERTSFSTEKQKLCPVFCYYPKTNLNNPNPSWFAQRQNVDDVVVSNVLFDNVNKSWKLVHYSITISIHGDFTASEDPPPNRWMPYLSRSKRGTSFIQDGGNLTILLIRWRISVPRTRNIKK